MFLTNVACDSIQIKISVFIIIIIGDVSDLLQIPTIQSDPIPSPPPKKKNGWRGDSLVLPMTE